MVDWFKKILRTGIEPNLTTLEQNALIITNIGLVTALVVNTLLMFFVPTLGAGQAIWSLIGFLIAAGCYFLSFMLIAHQHYIAGRTIFSIALVSVIAFQTYMFGTKSGMHWFLFPIGIGSVLIWPLMRFPQILVGSVTLSVFIFLVLRSPEGHIPAGFLSSSQLDHFALLNYALSFITTFIVVFSMVLVTEQFQQLLEDLRIKASLKAMNREEQMLASLNALALARDNETGNHIVRTQYYVKILADRLMANDHYLDELNPRVVSLLFKAAPLHDIGKIGIPDEVLLKPGPLTEDEWKIMKTHTSIGESVLLSAELQGSHDESGFEDVVMLGVQIAGCHHEKWDGTGYPRGLAGRSIPLSARIMALADMYDALISERVYKEKWSHEQAVEEIRSKSGTHFDPLIVEAFLHESDKFLSISLKFKD